MKTAYFKYISNGLLTLFLGSSTVVFSQDLGTKVVDVVKSYTPTIADAHKQREEVSINDSVTVAKKEINYTIYSVPVASTFVPEKGKATSVPRPKKENYNNSYVSLGLGTQSTLYGDASVNIPVNNEGNFAILLNHLSSKGNVKDVIPENNYSKTEAGLRYDFLNKDVNWGVFADVGSRLNKWYGMQEGLYTDAELSSFTNIAQTYVDYGLGGYVKLNNSIFKGLDFSVSGLSDDYDSSELRLKVLPTVEIPIDKDEQTVHANIIFDYLSSSFEQNFEGTAKISNQWMLMGVNPTYHFSTHDLAIKLGTSLIYAMAENSDDSSFKIYPDVEVSYRLLDEYAILHAGVRGMMQQNTYRELSKTNPFVSPTLTIVPTDVAYDVFLGIKGKIDSDLFYGVKASYKQYNNMPLFTTNNFATGTSSSTLGYQYNNSFKVVYDKVSAFGFSASLSGNVERTFYFTLDGAVNTYSTDLQAEAWNLPTLNMSLYTDVKVMDNLFVGADMFFVGSRKDMNHPLTTGIATAEIQTLDAFFDLNLHTDYTINNKWSVFVKANNLLSNNYDKWINYPVQGLQVLGGASYRFKL